ncbi:hypothetical protein ACHAWF_018858 [Thalassiosira exigua]
MPRRRRGRRRTDGSSSGDPPSDGAVATGKKSGRSVAAPPPSRETRRLFDLDGDCAIAVAGCGLAGLAAALAIVRLRSPSEGGKGDGAVGGGGEVEGGGEGEGDDGGGRVRRAFRGTISVYERRPRPCDWDDDLDASGGGLGTTRPSTGVRGEGTRRPTGGQRGRGRGQGQGAGYGMTLSYDPAGPLASLGILEDVAIRDCPSRCHYLFDERGNVRGYFGGAFRGGGGGGGGQRGNLRVPRAELRRILARALKREVEAAGGRWAERDAEADDGDGEEAGDDEGFRRGPRVRIVWNKRLESYEDRPMMEALHRTSDGRGGQGGGGLNRGDRDDGEAGRETQRQERERMRQRTPQQQQQQQQQQQPTHQQQQPKQQRQQRRARPVLLRFEDGSTSEADLLVGADGVNSAVARRYLSVPARPSPTKEGTPADGHRLLPEEEPLPRPLDVFLILGISDHFDPTMWQLSFPLPSSSSPAARSLADASPETLRARALELCGTWHAPIPDLVARTPPATIWGASLVDRDPDAFVRRRRALERGGRVPSRVVVAGDAFHAMSPFKGQGANAALSDGPALARWLARARPDAAVRGYANEAARRAGRKVRASREAAEGLHSAECWARAAGKEGSTAAREEGDVDDAAGTAACVFHGARPGSVPELLRVLEERGIGASLGSRLDEAIREVADELGVAEEAEEATTRRPDVAPAEEAEERPPSLALSLAAKGDLPGLRLLARRSSGRILSDAVDPDGRTCLHVAAERGDAIACRWLLSEVRARHDARDARGRTPWDAAIAAGRGEAARVLRRWARLLGGAEGGATEATARGRDEARPGTDGAADEAPEAAGGRDAPARSDGSIAGEGGEDDAYKRVEQQLRGIRTTRQLRALLENNRRACQAGADHDLLITRVLGFCIDRSEEEREEEIRKELAEEHGAVLLPNFVPREVDQVALGAIALRPLGFDLQCALDALCRGVEGGRIREMSTLASGLKESPSERDRKRADKEIEAVTSRLTIPANASIVAQTNFGPQMKSHSACESNTSKKRRMDSFPLSRLRYLNLGAFDYDWGERRYRRVKGAAPLPDRLASLARRAQEVAARASERVPPAPAAFDAAICNLYHLRRPSDRLGGHRDDAESDPSRPLVALSLGAPGIFLLGGESRGDAPAAILLRAGDCMVLSGRSRGYFHGVPAVLSDDPVGSNIHGTKTKRGESLKVFPELSDGGALVDTDSPGLMIPSLDDMMFVKVFLSVSRMNLSIRQVT